MKCERCNQNEATFFYQEQIGGKTKKIALCHACAAKEGLGEATANPFSLLLGGFSGLGLQKSQSSARCPACGATMRELIHEGRVGCAACYRTFEAELAPSIRAMHGNATHTGRAPHQYAAKKEKATRLEALREALQAAIATEDFEKAATLRDEIRALQNAPKEE